MRDFKTLTVWQKSHHLALQVYEATCAFPRDEMYGLTGQLRRAMVSVPANLAEGFGRQGGKERARFLNIALGSAAEVEYYFLLARDLHILPDAQYESLSGELAEVQRMLRALLAKIQSDQR